MVWIEGFKTGTHTAASGLQRTYTDADLEEMAATYNPEGLKAPVVIGHPNHNSPAWGWIDAVKKSGEKLLFKINEVDDNFKQWVNDRRFQNVSVSLYPPDSPTSPTPGKWYIRHLGFLGGVAPAVKGLNPDGMPAFTECNLVESVDFIEVNLDGLNQEPEQTLNQESYLESPSQPDIEVTPLTKKATPVETPAATTISQPVEPPAELINPINKPNEMTTQATQQTQPVMQQVTPSDILAANHAFSEKQREIEERDRKLAAREAEIAKREAAFQRERIELFCDRLIEDTKLRAEHKAYQVEFMLSLIGDNVVNFSDGIKQAPLDYHMSFLNALNPMVELSEIVTPSSSPRNNPTQPPINTNINFNLPPGYQVDPEQAELYSKISAYQKANNVSFAEACAVVANQ